MRLGGRRRRHSLTAALGIALLAAPIHGLLAQCPDGTPPPCTPPPAANTVAVLYFDSRGPDSTAYIAEGLTEEIITRLQQVRRLAVASRYASQRVRGRHDSPATLGRQLRVRFLVGGSVQRAAGRLVVRAELLRADRELGVWAGTYDRSGGDLLTLVDEIARAVATGVIGELLPAERASLASGQTRNDEAFRLFVLGNWLFTRRTQAEVRQAVAAYSSAVRLDSGFAAAWGRLGAARLVQAGSLPWREEISHDSMRALGLAAARRAISLDSTSGDAWMAVGIAARTNGEYAAAHEAFERSTRLDSLNAEAFYQHANLYSAYVGLGIHTAGEPLLRRAVALDRTHRIARRYLAMVLRDTRRLAEAEAQLETTLADGPWQAGLEIRASVRFLRGNGPGALSDNAEEARVAGPGPNNANSRALYTIAVGDSAPARDVLVRLRAQAGGGSANYGAIARFSMALGLHDDALTALEALRAQPDPQEPRCSTTASCSVSLRTWRLLLDPIFGPLHGDARFRRLEEETRPRIPWLDGAGGSNR